VTGTKKVQEILGAAEGKIFYDEPMSYHTSLRVGGIADALVFVESEAQLARIMMILKQEKIDYLPVGNLTNIIVRDGGYRGVIFLMCGLKEVTYQEKADGNHYIAAQAGAPLAAVVGKAAAHELTGLEFCAGIPGSVGGAVWMNAGAFGGEIKDVLTEITLFGISGRKKLMKREEMTFNYRRTILPPRAIILSAEFKLEKGKSEEIKEKMHNIMSVRAGKHPLGYPNAGSIFKNLPGMPAGRLIEEMGLKGKICGDAEISPQHANFIVNKGKATAADVLELISLIQNKAKREKNLLLETEVIIIGEN